MCWRLRVACDSSTPDGRFLLTFCTSAKQPLQIGFTRRPLRPGDGLVAVNGVNVCGMTQEETLAMLDDCEGIVTLTTLCRQGYEGPPLLSLFQGVKTRNYDLKMLQSDVR